MLRAFLACAVFAAAPAAAQSAPTRSNLIVRVVRDTVGVADAVVSAGGTATRSDANGVATLRLPNGSYTMRVNKLGFRPETVFVKLAGGRDTAITVPLIEEAARVSPIIVTSTRAERRLEQEPLRVEVLAGDDITEKNEMRPADALTLLRELSGVHMQQTSASLGGSAVRLQGLPGRYALVLNDGLPLYGAQSGGFGLAQVPPLDLRQAEVIKGASSALYGPSALSGVVNLVSRHPPDTGQILANQTLLGGTDLLGFGARRLAQNLGMTLLGGVHQQRAADTGHDGWSDIPALRRVEIRPRLFLDDSSGHSLMVTLGGFAESRSGGTIGSTTAGTAAPFADSLATRHADIGTVGHWQLGDMWSLGLRSSASTQSHRRRIGTSLEHEQQGTIFTELTATTSVGRNELVSGFAWQRNTYANRDVPQFDQVETTPGVFVQHTLIATSWLSTTFNARCDGSTSFGTICSPRASVLVHYGSVLSARLSAGAGWFAPMVLKDETEVLGLSHVVLPQPLGAERARTVSLDATATQGPLQVNGTLFTNRITSPVGLRAFATPSGDTTTMVALLNGPGTLRTWGGEVFGVYSMEPIIATAYIALTRSRELSPETGLPRELPLTPRTEAGLDLAYEEDESGTYVAAEIFYTGRQALDNDPYLQFGAPYTTLGVLASQRIGRAATVFFNVENITDVRLSRFEPVIRPTPAEGGRLTVDAWAPLEGRVFNLGVRYAL
ncbi:MAG: TonB-dependent receptor domain-containing protein [Gemmatimonadaceae bacterium]